VYSVLEMATALDRIGNNLHTIHQPWWTSKLYQSSKPHSIVILPDIFSYKSLSFSV